VGNQYVRKSEWKNALWVTRVAVVLGAFLIGVGLKDPRLFQTKVFALAAILTIALSSVAIVTALWGLQPMSSRLRDIRFWLSLILNLVVIAVVVRMYVHATAKPAQQKPYNSLEPGPSPT
jgi:hypothetical protein